jgi:hypothetical protein
MAMRACDKSDRSGEARVDGAGDGGAKGVLGGMGSSRGREKYLSQCELIPTKCHLASKISGLAVLSCLSEPAVALRGSVAGHVLGKLWGRGTARYGRR